MTRFYLTLALLLLVALAIAGWTVVGVRRLLTAAQRPLQAGERAAARRRAATIRPAL